MDFAGKRITVMGLGRFGGGLGVARWLVSQGADVLVTDLEPAEKLAESVAAIQDLVDAGSVTLRLGGHNVSDFTTCDLVVANPAVPHPWDNRFLRASEAAQVPITTEIRLSVERLPRRDRVIGTTGTAGKSTTSAMIAHALRRLGEPVAFGGNIGGSLLAQHIDASTWVVLELSSFQLYWLGAGIGYPEAAAWTPGIAVITNITPNHLDWHGGFDHYRACKLELANRHSERDIAIVGEGVEPPKERRQIRVKAQSTSPVPLLTPGIHNQLNARMAVAAIQAAFDRADDQRFANRIAGALSDFPGLPHRLCLVADRGGVKFYDDSKSTTPESTLLALDAFGAESARIHLIAGGYDKGSDLSPIAARAGSLAGLYCIGATGARLMEMATCTQAIRCDTLEAAVARAVSRAGRGDIVLLSPGCASWDQFVNYEARGRRFIELVMHQMAAGACT